MEGDAACAAPLGVVWARCPQSLDLLDLHRSQPRRYPYLLETAAAGAGVTHDVLFAFPGETLVLDADGLHGPQAAGSDFLAALDQWFAREAIAPSDTPWPFLGGWFFYLGYELAGQIEPGLQLPPAPGELPTALAVRCPAALIRERGPTPGAVYAVAESRTLLDALLADAAACAPQPARALPAARVTEAAPARHLRHVQRVRDYIRAGDVFQVNLSREWRGQLATPPDPADLYAALRRANPAPFAGLMRWKDAAVISSSPERLLRMRNGWAETRPIAGTRARTGRHTGAPDGLLTHPKERAEHVMLIDLERNDLGRFCEFGSVEVNEMMTLESYAHVHHIVSNVRGRPRAAAGPGAALRAVFPGGTITGCPKVRCMEIIAELEGAGRGAYTGSMGYLSRDGQLDSNILIRSLTQQGEHLRFRAGGGIVADSDPQRELDETRAKARGLLLSLGIDA